jgi:cytochrome b6-f complex iron-sulfur subunit
MENKSLKHSSEESQSPEAPPQTLQEALDRGMTRKEFLRKASAGALISFFGINLFACSENPTDSGGSDNGGGDNGGGNSGGDTTPGLTIDGDTITIEKGTEAGDKIDATGDFYNITDASVMLINIDGSEVRAFTNVCTHQQCTTSWSYGSDRLQCACHGSQFDENGNVVSGPATRPLTEYVVTQDDSAITVDKSQTAKIIA